jgi:hypothetical protein
MPAEMYRRQIVDRARRCGAMRHMCAERSWF